MATRDLLSVTSGILLAAVIASLALYYASNISVFVNYHLAYSLAWIAVLAASILGMPRLLNNTFTGFMGRSSYSIYLIHPVVMVCLKWAGIYKYAEHVIQMPLIALAVAAMLTIAIVLVSAWVSYRFVEEWAMKKPLRILNTRLDRTEA